MYFHFHWLHSLRIYPAAAPTLPRQIRKVARPVLHSKWSQWVLTVGVLHDFEFIFGGTFYFLKFGTTYCLTSTVYPNIVADQVILHLCQMETSHREKKNKHPRHMTGTFWSCKPLETWREEAVDLCGMKTDCGFSRWHGPGSLWKAHQLLVQSGPEGRADHTLTPATSTTLYVQYMSPTRASHPLILIALDVFLPIFSSCRDKKAFFKFSQLPPPTGFFSSSLSISLLSQRGSPCNC